MLSKPEIIARLQPPDARHDSIPIGNIFNCKRDFYVTLDEIIATEEARTTLVERVAL
jgi:hypothetical protein